MACVLTFTWQDDSSKDFYALVVYDAFGKEQWRAKSHRDTGPISTTEDLLGVFFIPGTVN